MNLKIPFKHTTIRNAHPRSHQNLKDINSSGQTLEVVPKPTKRYLKKLALSYVYCPDCESKDIIYYGTSSSETQKHRCKECGHQFVLNLDAVFPRSTRSKTFDNEFLSNIKPVGLEKGCGRKEYWLGARNEILSYLESRAIRIRFNKMLKTITIQGESHYAYLLRFIVHEAYVMVTD